MFPKHKKTNKEKNKSNQCCNQVVFPAVAATYFILDISGAVALAGLLTSKATSVLGSVFVGCSTVWVTLSAVISPLLVVVVDVVVVVVVVVMVVLLVDELRR